MFLRGLAEILLSIAFLAYTIYSLSMGEVFSLGDYRDGFYRMGWVCADHEPFEYYINIGFYAIAGLSLLIRGIVDITLPGKYTPGKSGTDHHASYYDGRDCDGGDG